MKLQRLCHAGKKTILVSQGPAFASLHQGGARGPGERFSSGQPRATRRLTISQWFERLETLETQRQGLLDLIAQLFGEANFAAPVHSRVGLDTDRDDIR